MANPIARPALECLACSTVTLMAHPHTGDECPACGDCATDTATVTPCDLGEDCRADDHHFGLDAHVSLA